MAELGQACQEGLGGQLKRCGSDSLPFLHPNPSYTHLDPIFQFYTVRPVNRGSSKPTKEGEGKLVSNVGTEGTSLWRKLAAVAASASTTLFCAALALRLSRYDEEGWLLVLFYATPWPVLAAIAGFSTLGWGAARSRALCLGAALACVSCTLARHCASWSSREPLPAEPMSLRFAFWNAGGPQQRIGPVIAHARTFDADFLAIGEPGSGSPEIISLWASTFPGMTVQHIPGEMLTVTRGTVQSTRTGSLGGKGRFNLVELYPQEKTLRVLLVDFDADFTRSRRPAFEALRTLAESHADQPLIVMGDFNTPARSRHFELLRDPLRDAWAAAGNGFLERWPVPIPLLRLDHVWTSRNVRPLRFQMDWSLLSDHRAQIVDVGLP